MRNQGGKSVPHTATLFAWCWGIAPWVLLKRKGAPSTSLAWPSLTRRAMLGGWPNVLMWARAQRRTV